jgi:tripartite-type tricarboxylate transporter receptor subunit TctC
MERKSAPLPALRPRRKLASSRGRKIMPRFVGWAIAWALLAASPLASRCTQAQPASSYPDRPVHLVVAFVPGGATDTLTRQLTEDLKEALGQPVVVENRPGANGYLAWNYVAAADPDGYTLLMAENALGISQGLFKKSASSFDPLTQYDAIASVAYSPLTLAVANKVKADTMAELIALARNVPQKMNYASAGVGSVSHLTWEVIRAATGIETVHVPYKGGGQAIGDVIAGHVDMNMAAVSVAKPLVESGRVKALAVTGSERSPALPQVPTLAEADIKTEDVDLRFWYALFGPKGIPPQIRDKLERVISTVVSSPMVRARLAKLDITPDFAPGSLMHARLKREIANWTGFIDAHGIKPE